VSLDAKHIVLPTLVLGLKPHRLALLECVWASISSLLLEMAVLHHEELVRDHEDVGLLPLEAIHWLVEAGPLRVILLALLTDAEHGRKQNSVRRRLS
jgi:hypothetical protein